MCGSAIKIHYIEGSLYQDLTINHTYKYSRGKDIHAALILVSCNMPVARKICGQVSALVLCHRCEKKANYEN